MSVRLTTNFGTRLSVRCGNGLKSLYTPVLLGSCWLALTNYLHKHYVTEFILLGIIFTELFCCVNIVVISIPLL